MNRWRGRLGTMTGPEPGPMSGVGRGFFGCMKKQSKSCLPGEEEIISFKI